LGHSKKEEVCLPCSAFLLYQGVWEMRNGV